MTPPRVFQRPHPRDRFRVENLTNSTAIYLYDEIGYWGTTASAFVEALTAIGDGSVDLHVNSPGGDVFDGLAIYAAVKNHPGTVTAYVDGLAASAASFIVMAANKVVMERNAQLMIHDAHGICFGSAGDMHDMAALLDKASDNIADIYNTKAGGSVAVWRAAMTATTWYSAQEALDAGLVDSVRGATAESEPVAATWDLSVFATAKRTVDIPAATDQAPEPQPAMVTVNTPPNPTPPPGLSLPVFDPDLFRDALREAVSA